MEKFESWLSRTGVAPVSKVTQQSFHGEEQEHAVGDVLAEYTRNGNRGGGTHSPVQWKRHVCVCVCKSGHFYSLKQKRWSISSDHQGLWDL